jgi:hypothetical protein
MTAMLPQSFYVPAADGFLDSTTATMSPWNDTQQHGGPPAALMARAIEQCEPRHGLAIARITVNFLGSIPQGRATVTARVVRPGKRIEMVEAELRVDGRIVASAQAWRVLIGAGAPSAGLVNTSAEPPPPQEQEYFEGIDPDWGYGRAIEWRFVKGGYRIGGPVLVWARPTVPLVQGEPTSGVQRMLLLADSINGLSAELDLREWLFVPPSLTLTLNRRDTGDWILLDAHTVVDPSGLGLAQATLSDVTGQLGIATQPLFIQAR